MVHDLSSLLRSTTLSATLLSPTNTTYHPGGAYLTPSSLSHPDTLPGRVHLGSRNPSLLSYLDIHPLFLSSRVDVSLCREVDS